MSVPALAPRPKAPVAARHHNALGASRDIDGRVSLPADNQALIPVDDCNAILVEMAAALEGAAVDQATLIAKAILGAYPSRQQDPEAAALYLRAVVMACAKCPPDLLSDLYSAVVFRNSPFLPTAGEIVAEINALVRKRREAVDVARAHLRAHQRRGEDKPVKPWSEKTPEERAAFTAMMDKLKAQVSEAPEVAPVDQPRPITSALFGAARLGDEARERLRAAGILKAKGNEE